MYMIVRGTFELSIRRDNRSADSSKDGVDEELQLDGSLDQTATTGPAQGLHGEFMTTLFNVAESGRLGRAELLAKRGSTGQMQTPAELVPIPESSVKALESCCILGKSRKKLVKI